MTSAFNPSTAIRQKLRGGDVCLGLFHLTASCLVSEALSVLPLDWLAYDMEASPANRIGLVQFLQSAKGGRATPFVRAQSAAHWHLEQILDAGANALIVPKVESREACEAVVAACKYPPQGRRGVNPIRASRYLTGVKDYFHSANDDTLLFVQIESRAAVASAHEILNVDGVDGAFVGCGDLAMDLGFPGEMEAELLLSAIDAVLTACLRYGRIPGVFAYSPELAVRFIRQGFRLVAFGNDITMLQRTVVQDCDRLRAADAGDNR